MNWRMAWPNLKKGNIETVIHVGLVGHHLHAVLGHGVLHDVYAAFAVQVAVAAAGERRVRGRR